MDIQKESLELHARNKGKLTIKSKVSIKNNQDLALAYTPGVAEPCKKIQQNQEDVYKYTAKGNMVAVVSDGSAVLGLGNIGPEAALPVMEGKAILFKEFADIDSVPLCVATQETAEIIKFVEQIAPTFGGINLEDISSPRCFEIEQTLSERLSIPVFHDDQHGTAVVVVAGILNALTLVGKKITEIKLVLNGPGAAGTAIVNMLLHLGCRNLLVCDEHGILAEERSEALTNHKLTLAKETNPQNAQGNLATALKDADVFVGVSVGNILGEAEIKKMNVEPIVFALANPVPEIMYQTAKKSGVKVMATGRSDNPNQVNNVLAFPGIFKGALGVRATTINMTMKVAAAEAIASIITKEELREDYIIPDPFDSRVVNRVQTRVAQAAVASGVNQIEV